MKEIFDILEEYSKVDFTEKKAAIATVVRVEGSSYRQPGARMLITDDGKLTGAISGGCLEGDALRKALLVMSRGKPMLVTYDTSDENDAVLGIGLGCNGLIHILIEPIDPADPANPVCLLRTTTLKRQRSVLITLFSMEDKYRNQLGTCLAYAENGTIFGSSDPSIPSEVIASLAREVLEGKTSTIKRISFQGNEITAFAELINPNISLVIAGAGNDVMPLAKLAGMMGWYITLLDGRPSHATCQRFPSVNQILVAEAGQALSKIAVDERTVFVLMTHNYNYDVVLLEQLLGMKVPYIGVLGPRKKLDRMLLELKSGDRLREFTGFDNIYGPVGLDIGAETAEEIALSVVAEIKAVLSGKPGKPLRNKADSIHNRMAEEKIPELKKQAGVRP